MITLNVDLNAGTAKLSSTTAVKFGAIVPVQVIFATAPGAVTGIELAMGDDSSAPTLLAYTNTFSQDNDTTWSGVVSTNTTQLSTFLTGKSSASVNVELTTIVDGNRLVFPNSQVTIQQLINNSSSSVAIGQTYYTEAEVDALITAEVAARNTAITNAVLGLGLAPNQADLTPAAAVTANLFAATEFSAIYNKIIPGAGTGAFTAAYTLPIASMVTGAIAEIDIEMPTSSNPTVEIHDGAGALLATLNNATGAAQYWYGRFRYNGTAWHPIFRAFQP